MAIGRGPLLAVLLFAVGSCKKDGAGAPDAASAPEPKPPTVTRWVKTHTYLEGQLPDGGRGNTGALLDPLTELEVSLPDGGSSARVWGGPNPRWISTVLLIDKKPSHDESVAAMLAALANGESEDAEYHAWLAWAADRKDFSPLLLASAIELAHGPDVSYQLQTALTGVAQPKPAPRPEALWPDAGEPAVGNVVYVAATEVGLRLGAKATMKVEVELLPGAALDVLQAQGDWLEVAVHVEPTDAGTVQGELDAGTDDDAGVAAVPVPAAKRGWIEKAAVTVVPLGKDALVADGSPLALELAAAIDPSDTKLLARAIEASYSAKQFARAVSVSEQRPDASYLKQVILTLAYGCRGNKKKAEDVLDPEALPAKVPPNACIEAPKFPACIECGGYTTTAKETRRKEREADRRDKLRKRFPDGPFVKAELGPGAPRTQRGFFIELPYIFQPMRCGEYEVAVDPKTAVVSEGVKLPGTDEDARVEWYAVQNDAAVYGFVLARSAEEARRLVGALPRLNGTELNKLAPEPNVAPDFDTCGDCDSCGD